MHNYEEIYISCVEKKSQAKTLIFQGLINLSLNQKNNFQAAMEITTNLQLEGMPDKDKAQVLIQSNVWTLISNSERSMIDEAMI